MIDPKEKVYQKWGFGMAPLKPHTELRYIEAVRHMRAFLCSNEPERDAILPMHISEVKGLVNRCIRQDQWDWFTVYSRLGCPNPKALRFISGLLPDLRAAVIASDTKLIRSLWEYLGWTQLLTCCLRFLGELPSIDPPPGAKSGHLYVLSTREFPDLLKIGFTTRSIETRVREINAATGVVFPLSVRRVFFVQDAQKSEKKVFEALQQYRIRQDREFFRVDYSFVVLTIEKLIWELDQMVRSRGTIDWFSDELGFGFALLEGDPDTKVFFHRSQVENRIQSLLKVGTRVSFEICTGNKGPFGHRIELCKEG